MSTVDFENINEILVTHTQAIRGDTVSTADQTTLDIQNTEIQLDITDFTNKQNVIELHVYSEDITKLFSIDNLNNFITERNKSIKDFFTIGNKTVSFKSVEFFKTFYPYFSGDIKLTLNFFKLIVSNVDKKELSVFEISSTRNESRIKYIKSDPNFSFIKLLSDFSSKSISLSDNLFINFSNDDLSSVLNILIESEDSIVIRFYTPVPSNVQTKQFCFVCRKIINTYVLSTKITGIISSQPDSSISLVPNFNIKINLSNEVNSNYKNLNSLVAVQNQSIILSSLSSSIDTLNVDYSKYSNFIYYSSAQKRLENFKYKLNKIQDYGTDISAYTSAISSLTVLNKSIVETSQSMMKVVANKNSVISSFTPYEKYLYYESSSYYTGSLGENFDSTWPKSNDSKPHTLYAISTSKALTWYTNQIQTSSLYDVKNLNILEKTAPMYIREDDSNLEYLTFVNMIGEYFDELKLYIDNITNRDVYKLKENEGITSAIAMKLINQFGLEVLTDLDNVDLTEYLNNDGADVSLYQIPILSKKNVLLKRILNNLIYFLKTKGTITNLHALANLFGVDRDYYEIREYGGPDIKTRQFNTQSIDIPSLEFLNLEYSLKLSGSQNVKLLWQDYDSKKPDTIIFKFKLNSTSPSSQSLFESENKFAVIAEKTNTSSNSGKLKFLLTGSSGIKSSSTQEIPIFDGNFWNVLLQRSVSTSGVTSNQTYTLKTNKVKFDRINNYVSSSLQITGSLTSSYNGSYNASTNFYIGGILPTSSFASSTPLLGNVSDLKFYRGVLRDDIFKQQSLAQTLLISNDVSSSFEDLVTHITFNDNKNLALTSSIYDANLSSYGKNHGTASGFSGNTFEVRYEKNIIKPKSIEFTKPVSTKVRIEDNHILVSGSYTYLNNSFSVETSSFDKYGKDSNRLDFIFSSTNIENKNIISSLNPEINDFIADPSFLLDDVESYIGLDNFYKLYRKYKAPVNLVDYISNAYKLSKNLFKNIKQFSPERVDFNAGILIGPNILERINVVLNKSVNIQNLTYGSVLTSTVPELVSNYLLYTSSISMADKSVVSEYIQYTSSISVVNETLEAAYSSYFKIIDVASNIRESADYLLKGSASIIERTDRIFTQGIKKRNFITSFVTSSNGPNFYTIQFDGIFEHATASFIEPISNFKLSMTYNTASDEYYAERNSAMEPLYDINYNSYYALNHIKHHIYNSRGRKRAYFEGALNTGPEHPSGATTSDGRGVIEITQTSVNTIEVQSNNDYTPRLKVEGIQLDL